jgi:diguanylate cyclase (GGDEF)-like protein
VFDQIQADRQRIRDLHREAQAREDMIALLMESTDEYEDGIIEVERRQGDLLEGQERLRKVNERLEELANTDLLTRLYNRRKGNAILADEWARVRRRVCHLGVVMIDLDHFKRINDTYGHAAGDVVLSTVADRIRETLRAYDSPVRWGGEEMLAVCPDASTTDAAAVAERLRVAIGGEAIQIGGGVTIHVTASLGVASSELGGYTSVEELIEAADSALYRAKHGGRDQVCWSGRPGSIGIPRADGSVPGPFHIESC